MSARATRRKFLAGGITGLPLAMVLADPRLARAVAAGLTGSCSTGITSEIGC